MRYSLRSLMLVAILAPAVLAGIYLTVQWLRPPKRLDPKNDPNIIYGVDVPDIP